MKLLFLTVGERSPAWADAAVADYGDRLRRMVAMGAESVRPEPFKGDVDAVRGAESTRLLAKVTPRDRLVVVDERGQSLDSHGFAKLLAEGLMADGRLVFAIGGAYGHDASLRARAWKTVRLGDAVMNHEIARVVLVEQVYRSFTINRGVPYHH